MCKISPYNKNSIIFALIVALIIVAASLQISSLQKYKPADLLSIQVIESKSMPFEEFNQRIENASIESIPWADDPLEVAIKFAGIWGGKQRVISLDDTGSPAHVILIIDKISDDSVRGYRYDIKLELGLNRYIIIDAKESWNCWSDRGHTEYSIEPCA